MASGPSSSMSSANPFSDFGIKDLLGDSCEDEETFWAHFSENLAECRAELEKNPLTFPIPPTEELVFPTTPSDQPTSNSTPSRPRTQPHHCVRVLAESKNAPTATATLNDEDVDKFIEQHENINTKRKTESDLRKWYQWCEKHGEKRDLQNIPPTELDRLLGHFFISVRKSDGSKYEPDTLTSLQRSIDRHLT